MMVRSVLNIMYKEVCGLHQAAYILAIFTLGSQLLALVRDRLLAHQFGAGIDLDLYYTAFRIPDFLYVLFASTLSVYVLIPFISKHLKDESYERARLLLSHVYSLFIIGYICIAGLTMICAPYIVQHFFPGFTSESETLVLLIRILLVQPLFLGVSSLYGVVTQMEHRFVLYAIGPLVYNLGIIFGLLFLYPTFGITGLALGVVLGAFGHMCMQIPFVMQSKLAPRLVWTFDMREIISICRISVTRALTLSLHQIVLLGLISFASIMSVGSVSVFQFAFNLQSVPLAIIGVSYSVAIFPLLAQLCAEKRMDVFGNNILTALRHIMFWSLPTIALFIVIRAQFVRVILGSGEFDWNDTRLTAAILAIFILSLTSQAIHLLIVRALYAVGNTRLPLFATLFSSSVALLSSFVFYSMLITHGHFSTLFQTVMRLPNVQGIEVLALPLGYSLALIMHSFVILFFARTHNSLSLRKLTIPFFQSVGASIFGGYVAYVSLNFFVTKFTTDTLMTIFAQGLIAGIGGCAGYVLLQFFFKNEELFEVFKALRKRLVRKGDIIVPQDEDHLAV